jgi:hypothetical protein
LTVGRGLPFTTNVPLSAAAAFAAERPTRSAFSSAGGWKQKLGCELQAARFEIDWNKVMRQRRYSLQLLPFSQFSNLVVGNGERAGLRFLEFFTSDIRKRNTRDTHARAVNEFLTWYER